MTTARVKDRQVVLLNTTYEELGRLTIQKAARLLALGKAVVHEADESGRKLGNWAYPKVVRLVKFVKVNYEKLYGTPMLTKHGVLLRDKRRCAYCGKAAKTVDHVMPRSRCKGNPNTWLNLVAACFSCNNKKDNRTPEEARMPLLFPPRVPTRAQLIQNRNR